MLFRTDRKAQVTPTKRPAAPWWPPTALRALYASYNGPLYPIMRQSDGKTLDIGVVQPSEGDAGEYADFDNYAVEEPRARGIEREIPVNKTIVLTSGADGTFLAADTENNTRVNVASGMGFQTMQHRQDADATGGAVPPNAKFQVVDLGLGRVALKTGNGKVVSIDNERAIVKDLGDTKPGPSGSFQWINLMRGDTMLMSLMNHQYLATQLHHPGPVTATAAGPQPARKSGAEFKWKAVE